MDVALTELVKEAFNGKTPTKPRIIQALDTVREFNRLEPKRRNDEFSPSYHARLAVAGALVESSGRLRYCCPSANTAFRSTN